MFGMKTTLVVIVSSDDTLRRLRKKLPNLNIHTIYGYGYRLG